MKTLLISIQNNSVGGMLAKRFHEGGPFFMSLILISLLLSVFFLVMATISLNKNEAKFKKMISLVSEMSLLGLVLGVLASVIGMIEAFDAIEAAGDISPSLVAGGIKVALITTVGGLIVAIILQVFYNYIVAKIDSLANSMEDASISLVDLLVRHKLTR